MIHISKVNIRVHVLSRQKYRNLTELFQLSVVTREKTTHQVREMIVVEAEKVVDLSWEDKYRKQMPLSGNVLQDKVGNM